MNWRRWGWSRWCCSCCERWSSSEHIRHLFLCGLNEWNEKI
jgi:hypothetical protein